MEIRLMDLSDYDSVYSLWVNTDGMGMRSLDDSREGIAAFLRRNPSTNFVAVINGAVVGVILCGHDGRRAYIYHMAVCAEQRGRGIGRALADTVLCALEREGITKAALVAFRTNSSGNAFWDKLGFEERGDLVYRNKSLNSNNV